MCSHSMDAEPGTATPEIRWLPRYHLALHPLLRKTQSASLIDGVVSWELMEASLGPYEQLCPYASDATVGRYHNGKVLLASLKFQ